MTADDAAEHPLRGGSHSCSTHLYYQLTCEDFEALQERAQNRCEICGVPGDARPHRSLHIDHDAEAGDWAVRGLLCSRCNTQLDSNVQVLDAESVVRYLANSWCRVVLENPDHMHLAANEPPLGTVVVIRQGGKILRTENGWIRVDGPMGRRWQTSWHGVVRRHGPHNLRVEGGQVDQASDSATRRRFQEIVSTYEASLEQALRDRNEKLLRAQESGRSQADIVRITGLSRETVRQAVKKATAARKAAK